MTPTLYKEVILEVDDYFMDKLNFSTPCPFDRCSLDGFMQNLKHVRTLGVKTSLQESESRCSHFLYGSDDDDWIFPYDREEDKTQKDVLCAYVVKPLKHLPDNNLRSFRFVYHNMSLGSIAY